MRLLFVLMVFVFDGGVLVPIFVLALLYRSKKLI